MNKQNLQNLYQLLRDIGNVLGIARTTVLALHGFIESIQELKCSREEIVALYSELAETIKNSEPKIIPLIHLIEQFEDEMRKHVRSGDTGLEEIKVQAVKVLEDKIELFKSNARKVTESGLAHVRNDDVILVHSASSVVTNILVRAREVLNRNFKVIILEQNLERTRQLIQAFERAGVEYRVVRDYNLDHYIGQATKMFLGALTVTSDRKIVAPVGTCGTVSLCHLNNVAVYLFANTLHFSHRKATDQLIYQGQEDMHLPSGSYHVTTHSHCLIDLHMIDQVITEMGEMGKIAYSEYLL